MTINEPVPGVDDQIPAQMVSARPDLERPPRVQPSLKAAPSIRDVLWCDFPKDAHLPEMWKCRPVIVISYKNKLHGAVTVIPCSSGDQQENPWAYPLKTRLEDGRNSWAICDKPATVAVSRLSLQGSHGGRVRRLPVEEFNGVLTLLLKWLPRPE